MAVIMPQNITFVQWISLLKMDYPNATIPQVENDTNWKAVARQVMNEPNFSSNAIPTPDVYAEPNEWIAAFSNALY